MSYDPAPLATNDPYSYEIDESLLHDLYARRREELLRAAAFKTVDIFSGIVRKRLTLKDGSPPRTDLRTIFAPFDGAYFYQDVEHALSHILFQSDSIAKRMFIEEYVKRVTRLVKKQGIDFNPNQQKALAFAINHIFGVTEDHRCESLWALIYRGSFDIMRDQAREGTEHVLDRAHQGLCVFYSLVEAGHTPGPGELDRFRPYLEEALRKVECRGFAATLIVSKWLLSNLVSELIREMNNIPPPPPPKQGNQNKGKSGTPNLWDPPEVDATPKERAQALRNLLDKMGTQNVPEELTDRANDVEDSKYQDPGASKKAAKVVSDALKLDIHDAESVNKCLDGSADQMQDILAEVFQFLRQRMTSDEWIRQGTEAKVVFRDVRKRDVSGRSPQPLLPEDMDTVRRLRAVFHQVMGRRATILDDMGSEIDIGAYIQRKVTGEQIPVFRQEVRGRGFKCLVLIDRSWSMGGGRTVQAERAARVIARSLKFPFVEMALWGFQSLEDGQIDIVRFDPSLEVFHTDKSPVRGYTPIHLAIRAGVRHLERGSEAKHLVVTTDGFPVYTRRDGRSYPTTQLMAMVRDEVLRAKKRGIQVTGVVIGEELAPKHMSFMFGKGWKYMPDDRFGSNLVQLVSNSFMNYLRRG